MTIMNSKTSRFRLQTKQTFLRMMCCLILRLKCTRLFDSRTFCTFSIRKNQTFGCFPSNISVWRVLNSKTKRAYQLPEWYVFLEKERKITFAAYSLQPFLRTRGESVGATNLQFAAPKGIYMKAIPTFTLRMS